MSTAPRASQILLVGQRIRQLRKSRHLTQADLASRIGITQSDLSRMESGEYKVGLDTLFRILQVFELSMSRFFEEPAQAEVSAAAAAAAERAEAATDSLSEREQLFSDFTELPDDSRREVREFIAFKKMQADSRRGQWAPSSGRGSEPESRETAGATLTTVPPVTSVPPITSAMSATTVRRWPSTPEETPGPSDE